MIVSFKDEGTEDIFNGENTKAARKACPESLWRVAAQKLDQLDSVQAPDELHIPPGNRLEGLDRRPQRTAQHSICNWRLGFVPAGAICFEVQVLNSKQIDY